MRWICHVSAVTARQVGRILQLCIVLIVAPLAASAQVTMDWSAVGGPGNAADSNGYGAVSYSYDIGTYDVTVDQYVTFLNAKANGGDPLQLYNGNMSDPYYGGVLYNPTAADGSKYSAMPGDGNHPINYVSGFDAFRFANWMNNGQGNADTESGAYTLLGDTPIPSNFQSVTRSAGAAIFIPTVNEWYKAAYFNPSTHSYFKYPTSSNSAPVATTPTAAANSANFLGQPNSLNPLAPDNLTNVGAYSATTSPSGAFDMGGNVFQWNETSVPVTGGRIALDLRGGSFTDNSIALQSSSTFFNDPVADFWLVGFRLASIPSGPLFADVNHDGIVNGQDIALIASDWLKSGIGVAGDANGDGVVNGQDIAMIASSWLESTRNTTSVSAVPEPSALSIATVGLLSILTLSCRRSFLHSLALTQSNSMKTMHLTHLVE